MGYDGSLCADHGLWSADLGEALLGTGHHPDPVLGARDVAVEVTVGDTMDGLVAHLRRLAGNEDFLALEGGQGLELGLVLLDRLSRGRGGAEEGEHHQRSQSDCVLEMNKGFHD
jgi:hypothetical protein